jgi:protein transport protein SEC24
MRNVDQAGRGGHSIFFHSTLPNVGLGALQGLQAEADLFDTDKEKTLFKPRELTWLDIGEELAMEGIGVSMFLAPNRYMDVGSVGVVASSTGGELFLHPRFEVERDGVSLESQLQRLMRRFQGYNATMRFRSSSGNEFPSILDLLVVVDRVMLGLNITNHFGNFTRSNLTDLEFGIIDADKAIMADFEHSSTLSTREYAYIQCATLYTSIWGERRVRVINLALQVVELAGNVYQFADSGTVLCRFAREGTSSLCITAQGDPDQ